jgi:hypothetical protein
MHCETNIKLSGYLVKTGFNVQKFYVLPTEYFYVIDDVRGKNRLFLQP